MIREAPVTFTEASSQPTEMPDQELRMFADYPVEYVKEDTLQGEMKHEPHQPSDSILDILEMVLAQYELATVTEVIKHLIENVGDLTWDDALDIINARARCHQFVNEDEFTCDLRPQAQVRGASTVHYFIQVIPLGREFRETFENSTLLRKLQIIQELVNFAREQWGRTLSITRQHYEELAYQIGEELRRRILLEGI